MFGQEQLAITKDLPSPDDTWVLLDLIGEGIVLS